MSGTLNSGTCVSFSNVPLSQSSTTVSGHAAQPRTQLRGGGTCGLNFLLPSPFLRLSLIRGDLGMCMRPYGGIFTSHGIGNVVESSELQGIRICYDLTLSLAMIMSKQQEPTSLSINPAKLNVPMWRGLFKVNVKSETGYRRCICTLHYLRPD